MKSSQHWYTIDGKPRHGATLREARKEGLLVSVTSVLQVWPKGALDRWKQEQVILSCLTTPRLPHESDDAYIARVIECAEAESMAAADVGTRRHDLIERWNKGGELKDETPEEMRFIEPYIDWFNENVDHVIQVERVVVNEVLGYAGKLDLLCELKDGRRAVVDVKNRRTPRIYGTDAQQMEAYSMPVMANATVSVILGTAEPVALVRDWTPAERHVAWANFQLCLSMWKASKNYYPEKAHQEALA
jgi:hypothetical protein